MGDRIRPPSETKQQELTKSSHGQCAPATLIHSEMRCTTMPSIPRQPCGDIPSHGSARLAIWLLDTITTLCVVSASGPRAPSTRPPAGSPRKCRFRC